MHTKFHHFVEICRLFKHSHYDNFQTWLFLKSKLGSFYSIHNWHFNIEKNNIRIVFINTVYELFPILCLTNNFHIVQFIKHNGKTLSENRVIINYERL